MSSYLEAYGESEARREQRIRIVKISGIVLGCVLVLGFILYGIFQDYGEEQQAKTFIELLRAHDYQRAYQLWGCTDATPCPAYPFSKFLEDWGPQEPSCRRVVRSNWFVAILRFGRGDPHRLQGFRGASSAMGGAQRQDHQFCPVRGMSWQAPAHRSVFQIAVRQVLSSVSRLREHFLIEE